MFAIRHKFRSAMATGLVRAALCAILTDSDYLQDIERSRHAVEEVRQFIQAINEDEPKLERFDRFASNLMKALEKCFFGCISKDDPCRSKSVKREKIWSAFHQLRIGDAEKMWCSLFDMEGIPKLSPLVYQHINEKLYADLIKSHFSATLDSHSSVDVPALTADEENMIRYAAGFVPFKLLKWYEKSSTVDAVCFTECLSSLAVDGDESSLLEYTTKWTRLVNRGGLFEINDTAFMLFKEIELIVRKHLFITFERGSSVDSGQHETITAVANDDSVQFFWTMLSVDIDGEEQAVKLLKEIIGLWVTIRGFSIAGTWMEQYLHATKGTSKTKGLRKELKRKSVTTKKNPHQS